MTRYLALAFATIGSACASLETTARTDALSSMTMPTLNMQPVNLADQDGSKSTVPMITEEQKDGPLDTLARTLHIYWFFGSR